MALNFANSLDMVNHGNAASVNNLDNQTWLFWLYPNSVTNANRRLVRKGANQQLFIGNDVNDGSFLQGQNRATTATLVRTPANTITVTAWQFLGLTSGDNVVPKIYRGTLTTAVAEIGSYETQTTGVGAPTDDSASALLIGSRDLANTHCDCRVAYVWVYNRILTAGEIALHQFQPGIILSGCVLKCAYGFNGTGTQADLSGNGNNGTVTGSAVVDHVPLGPPYGFARPVPYAVTAVAAATDNLMLMGVGG